MPNRHNGNNYHTGSDAPTVEMTRGMRARVEQLKAAYAQEESVVHERREGGHMTGMVATRKQTEVAQNALERQIRYQRGQYPVRKK